MATNDFLPFATGVGANVESQASYLSDANRPLGNQPGIASAEFCNKAWRQSSFITSQVAQMVSDLTGSDIADNGINQQFLAQLKGLLATFPPKVSLYTSSSGTHNLTFYFFIIAGNATSGATYTNGSGTFTVVTTIAGATVLRTTGSAFPAAISGVLTKTGGTGDSTISFFNYRAPTSVNVKAVGAGGNAGGAGNGSSGPTGSNGGDTTFGTSFITAGGGVGGIASNSPTTVAGGTASIVGATGIASAGQKGQMGGFTITTTTAIVPGGAGGASGLGYGGYGSGGFGTASNNATSVSGGGGSGGGGVDCTFSPAALALSSFAYSIGAVGATGNLGQGGMIQVTENFQ